ncbi:hypothetical protein [Actinomadura viridis]|uniref:Uncharacterized protein n=1 Tax=Actinomadura viridis TaxID=58110 RepID=A0A931GRQ5_9ACTN|nr:hypothetical protein [Actinomadura viridis]MBG6089974.1 hypothetical protein [Actinomadura viridis]
MTPESAATTVTSQDPPVPPAGAAPFPGPDQGLAQGPARTAPRPQGPDGMSALTDLAQQTRTDQDGGPTDG